MPVGLDPRSLDASVKGGSLFPMIQGLPPLGSPVGGTPLGSPVVTPRGSPETLDGGFMLFEGMGA